jgi:hypothetical protein
MFNLLINKKYGTNVHNTLNTKTVKAFEKCVTTKYE